MSDAADRLERSAGRTAAPASRRARAERSRPKLGRAFVVIAVLAVALVVVASIPRDQASIGGTETPPTTPVSAEPEPSIETVDGVVVETFTPPDAGEYYALRVGAPAPPRAGPPACARGEEDDRAWSRPEAPTITVGRYRCRLEDGRAAIWWYDDRGHVVHATAPHADLARLFTWWQEHSEQ